LTNIRVTGWGRRHGCSCNEAVGRELEKRTAGGRYIALSSINAREGSGQPRPGDNRYDDRSSENASLHGRKCRLNEKKAHRDRGPRDGWEDAVEVSEGCRVGDKDASSVSALTPRRNLLSIRHLSRLSKADVPGRSCISKTLEHGAQEEERAG
jgi:hypothetical protein